jgi:hypothetical protein
MEDWAETIWICLLVCDRNWRRKYTEYSLFKRKAERLTQFAGVKLQ